MLNVCIKARHTYTIAPYIADWAQDLRGEIRLFPYAVLPKVLKNLQPGPVIFADIERLSAERREAAGKAADEFQRLGYKVYNHPKKVLRRFELLRTLYEQGINEFNVYRTDETPRRWPVFVRPRSGNGEKSFDLLNNESEVEKKLEELTKEGKSLKRLLIVEYVDARGERGLYRNYSILRIGDTFIPRHLWFSDNWVVRHTTVPRDQYIMEAEKNFDEELGYAHIPEIKRIFDIANITYGRIDYCIVNGKIQVWEINTNPNLVQSKRKLPKERWPRTLPIVSRISAAFDAIDIVPKTPIYRLNQANSATT